MAPANVNIGVKVHLIDSTRSRGARLDFPLDFLAQTTVGDIEVVNGL